MEKNRVEIKKRIIGLPLISRPSSALPSQKVEEHFGSAHRTKLAESWEWGSPLKMEQEVRGALSIYENQKEKMKFFADADVKISRHQFGKLLLSLRSQIGRFHSVGLFVQFMLHELSRREGTDVATLAAAGTWGLQLLVKQEVGSVLESIQNALLPALYCDYNPHDLPFASAAIQTQIRDGTLVRENPYFTHSMYVEQARIGLKNIAHSDQALHCALEHNENRRRYILRVMCKDRRRNLQNHFNAWRQFTRRRHVLDMTTKKRQERQEALHNKLRLRMVFSTWRLTVENSRVQFLGDRLHDVSAQLENSKRHFQLQCIHTSLLSHTANRARAQEEESEAREQKLLATIEKLQKQQEKSERAHRKQLAIYMRGATSVVQKYRSLVEFFLEARAYTNVFAGITKDHAIPALSVETPSGDCEEEVDFMEIVIRWCNYAVHETLGPSYQPFTFLVPEFFTGEYYLIILHFVFPDRASLYINRDSNIQYRLRRICEICGTCGLLHRLVPEDFTMQREDLIVLSLGELFKRYLFKIWRETCESCIEKAPNTLPVLPEESGSAEFEGEIGEESMEAFTRLIDDCAVEQDEKKMLLIKQFEMEKRLISDTSILMKEESHMWGERTRGAPLRVLSEPHRQTFSRINMLSLVDVTEKLPKANMNEENMEDELNRLQALLYNDHTLSRIFYHYAGEGEKMLSEAGFWRFIEHSTFHSGTSTATKASIAQIIDKVNFPQLEAAKHAASHGQGNMNVETLVLVAKHEVDIRYITPVQFVEIMIRIAVEYSRFQLSLFDSVARFLEVLTVPSLKHFPPILQQFYGRDAQEVVRYFSDELFRVFSFFLRQQEQSKFTRDRLIAVQDGGRFGAIISRRTYETMFVECGYLETAMSEEFSSRGTPADSRPSTATVQNAKQTKDCLVTEEEMDTVLRKIIVTAQRIAENGFSQANPTFSESRQAPQHLELTFTMFLETFGVFCQYWCPDPFVPYSRKVAGFIAHTLEALMRMHTSDTLVLSAPPVIDLEGDSKVTFSENSPLR